MKVKHLDGCMDHLRHLGADGDLRSPEAYSVMVDYAYSHRVGCDPDDFVEAMRRFFRSAKSSGKEV